MGGAPVRGALQSLGVSDPGIGRAPAFLVAKNLGADAGQAGEGLEQGSDLRSHAAGNVVGTRRDGRVQEADIGVDDVIHVQEIPDAVEVAHPHGFAVSGLDPSDLLGKIRGHEICFLARTGVVEGANDDDIPAALGGFVAQVLGGGLGFGVCARWGEGGFLAEGGRLEVEGRVLVPGPDQQEASPGCVGFEGFDDVPSAAHVDPLGEAGIFRGSGDEGDGREMNHGLRRATAHEGLDRRGITHVDRVDIEAAHPVARRLEAGNEPASHEAARAGHQDFHGRSVPQSPGGRKRRRGLGLLPCPSNGGIMIIGVSGRNGAGKGAVIEYLGQRSFYVFSLSDVVREELERQGVEETRDRMIEAGRGLREAGGAGALAEGLIPKLQPDRNYAIDSIRHPAEVEALRRFSPEFKLIWVDAGEEKRLERIRARGRSGDPSDLAELRALEARELSNANAAGQQLLAVQEMADFTIENEGEFADLHAAVREVFRESLFFERPTWDRYFMNIAQVVASRSNCVKRKVAAVVTRDRRIISTGYNGTPRGTRNCNEGGCPRCNDLAPGGTGLLECFCSHGEENAITQASYHGVSLQDSTLYTTFSPCLQCTKMIINAGLSEVIYNAEYPLGERSLDLLQEAGIKVRQVELED